MYLHVAGLKKMFGKKESKHLHNDREEQQTEVRKQH